MSNTIKELTKQIKEIESNQDTYAYDFQNEVKDKGRNSFMGLIKRNGNKWAAYFFYFTTDGQNKNKKKCLAENCRSKAEAEIILNYNKQFNSINHPKDVELINTNDLNLN